MTRFEARRERQTSGGRTLTVLGRRSEENALDLLANRALEDVERALRWLARTITEVNRDPIQNYVSQYADRYFLTGANLGRANAHAIVVILEQTLNGLNGDVTLKVGRNVGQGDKDVYGAVRPVSAATNTRTKSYHNVVFDLSRGEDTRMGAMRIARDTLGTLQGAVTVIHEATHKYAGTWDYAYFGTDGNAPTDAFHTMDKALENADGYAWFVQRVARY